MMCYYLNDHFQDQRVKIRWQEWAKCLAYDAALPMVSTAISNAEDTILMC